MTRPFVRPLLVLLLLLLPSAAAAQLWEARHDMTPASFQAAFDELTPRGFVPHEMAAVERDGGVRFTAVWRREPAVAWEARYGLTSPELQGYVDRFTAQGYAPTKIIGYGVGDAVRFAAIWRREPGAVWEARWGLTPDGLQRDFDEWSPRGYAPRAISAYTDGGEARFATVWRRDTGRAWEAHASLTEAQYQATYDRLTPRGYVPLDFAAYRVNGETRFVGVWERVSGTAWEARHGMTSAGYLERARRRAAEGWAPYVVSAYPDGRGGTYYAAAWRLNAQPAAATVTTASPGPGAARPPVRNRAGRLAIQPVHQQTLVWCWLAVGEMVFRHYGVPSANAAGDYQCGIIGRISGPTSPCWRDCYQCVMPSGSNYGTLSMLSNYARLMADRRFRYSEARVVSAAAVIENIDARRPLIAGISYNLRLFEHDSEHVVLIVGYEVVNGRMFLVVNDPYPYPQGANPFLRHGGTLLRPYQYRISYEAFRDRVFWHWTVHDIALA